MDTDQLEQKVSWLDDERRRGSEVLEAVQKRLAELESSLGGHEKRLEEVGSDLARMSALASAVSQFDESLHNQRQEISRQLEDSQKRREQQTKDMESLHRADKDALNKRINELRKEFEGLSEFEEVIENRRKEEVKLTRLLDSLEKRMRDQEDRSEDHVRSIGTLEESRNSDSKRLGELQAEVSNLRNNLEKQRGTQDLFDDRSRRLESQVLELKAAENERRETLEAWSENQSRKLADFGREWSNWEDRFSAFEKMAAELDERMVRYQETFLNTKQLHTDMEKTMERLERRIHEVGEIQRLGENRQKQEWSVFLADEQKRWNTFKLTSEEQWREHDRGHEQLAESVKNLEDDAELAVEEQKSLTEGVEKRVRSLLRVVRDWADDLEKE